MQAMGKAGCQRGAAAYLQPGKSVKKPKQRRYERLQKICPMG